MRVWHCDTNLDGLKPRLPKDTTENKNISEKDLDDDFTEAQKSKEVHGETGANEKKSGKKVKYSCAAKYVIFHGE